MRELINYQTIKKNGKPIFVVVPYDEFVKFYPEVYEDASIPHELVCSMVSKNISRIRAWREYLGLTQKEVADKMNISQAGYSQIEAVGAKPRKNTLEKLCKIFKISIEQLK